MLGFWFLFNILSCNMGCIYNSFNRWIFSCYNRICFFFGKFFNFYPLFYSNNCTCMAFLSSKVWNCINSIIWFDWNCHLFLFKKLIMIRYTILFKTNQFYLNQNFNKIFFKILEFCNWINFIKILICFIKIKCN